MRWLGKLQLRQETQAAAAVAIAVMKICRIANLHPEALHSTAQ